MKNLICFLLILTTFAVHGQPGLFHIESRINAALTEDFQNGNSDSMSRIAHELHLMKSQKDQHWLEYWTAYHFFNQSVYFAYAESAVPLAQLKADTAIQILKSVDNKNSEDYALMGYIKGFTLQWIKGMKIMKESAQAQKWIDQALLMDAQNPRAVYVAANQDFYTPSFVGGGRKAKKLFLKALDIYKNSPPNPMLPSWGFADCYAGLVNCLRKDNDDQKAEAILKEALSVFPDNHELNRLNSGATQK